jgi:hypothetical protein
MPAAFSKLNRERKYFYVAPIHGADPAASGGGPIRNAEWVRCQLPAKAQSKQVRGDRDDK